MKQVIQSYKSGEVRLANIPIPALRGQDILVRTAASLISVGTESHMLGFARKSMLGKAKARPDLVRQVIDKSRIEGPLEAYRQAMGRLDSPVPLGYSAAGEVIEVGDQVSEFKLDDRVVCSGSGIASHAEILRVPKTMAAIIPEGVSFENAAFGTLGAIALHGVRMGKPTLGDIVVVIGLGLLGQLAIQLLNASGCNVFAIDLDRAKVKMALEHGARAGAVVQQEDTQSAVLSFTNGIGADVVYVFASTLGNEPIELAAKLARDRGRVIVPGLVGLELPRKEFFEKELEFCVSRAWGAGMYDPKYESGQRDYPIAYVRWTAQRNLAAVLELLSEGKLVVSRLITHRFHIENALEAYELILQKKERTIGVLLEYPKNKSSERTIHLLPTDKSSYKSKNHKSIDGSKYLIPLPEVGLGIIGAGLYANGTILPALQGIKGIRKIGIATRSGMSGEHFARKAGFEYCTTDLNQILLDPNVDLIMVLTRHGSHAELVCRALDSGKHVFVEKPLAINEGQLSEIIGTYAATPGQLMVGFNRRFSPTLRSAMSRIGNPPSPLMVNVRVNVGYVSPDSWVHDPKEGGGNIIGEACHFFDLVLAITNSVPELISTQAISKNSNISLKEDNFVTTLKMKNGNVGTIMYTTMGNKAFSRERVEIFGNGTACVIENFKTMRYVQNGRTRRLGSSLSGVDRGHRAEMKILFKCLYEGRPFPILFEDYVTTTKASFAALESLKKQIPIELN